MTTRPTWRIAAVASILALSQCTSSAECTEVDCDDEATVTYPAGLVFGAYDLVLASEGMMIGARCLDPSAPEVADNPAGLTCDASSFVLVGEDLANRRSLRVTIIDVASGDTLVDGSEVILNAVGEEQPNGPGCPPTCFIRSGRLLP